MAKFTFTLLEGQHEQADKTKPRLGQDGKPTGRFHVAKFKKGDRIQTDTDLAAKFGANKFQLVGTAEPIVAPEEPQEPAKGKAR